MKARRLPGGARPVFADQVVQCALSFAGNFANFLTGGPGALQLGDDAIEPGVHKELPRAAQAEAACRWLRGLATPFRNAMKTIEISKFPELMFRNGIFQHFRS